MSKSLREKFLSVRVAVRGADEIVGFETKLERHQYTSNINSVSNNNKTSLLRIEGLGGGSEGIDGSNYDYRQSPFYKALEPLMFYMRMFGIFYDKPSHGLSRGLPSPSILYCWTVTLVGWLNFIITITAIRKVCAQFLVT